MGLLRATLLATLLLLPPLGAAFAKGAVLVINSGEASLSVFDLASRAELRRIPVLREPHHWALTPDGKELLIGDTVGNELFVLDARIFALLRRMPVADPYQLGFSPDGRLLAVNGLARNQVDIYEGAGAKLVKRFPLKTMPSHLTFSPDSSMVFVSLQGTGKLAAIDLRRMSVAWEAPVGKTPAGVMWHGGKVLVALMGEDNVAVVNPTDGRVETRVVTAAGAHQIFLSPDGRTVWVNNRVAGSTTALDAATLGIRRTYRLPGGPDDIAFSPDGKLWITQRFAHRVAILDPATGAVESLPAGRSPHGIFLNPDAAPSGATASAAP